MISINRYSSVAQFLCASFSVLGMLVCSSALAELKKEPAKDPAKGILEIIGFKSHQTPQAIYRYSYKGKIVYLAEMPCCDQFNVLFSRDLLEICAPSGGFSGAGDGKCPDFVSKKRSEKLIWKSGSEH